MAARACWEIGEYGAGERILVADTGALKNALGRFACGQFARKETLKESPDDEGPLVLQEQRGQDA